MVTLLQQLEREFWILNHHLSWPAGCLGDCLDRRKRCCHCHWGDCCLINLYGPLYTQRLVLEWGSKVRAREKRTVIPGSERKPQGTLSSQWPHANGTRKFKEAEKLWHYLALLGLQTPSQSWSLRITEGQVSGKNSNNAILSSNLGYHQL